MAEDMTLAAMFEYYERGGERGRLDEPAGQLEFARTRQIIARHLPPPPATVAGIGGGPGRYSAPPGRGQQHDRPAARWSDSWPE